MNILIEKGIVEALCEYFKNIRSSDVINLINVLEVFDKLLNNGKMMIENCNKVNPVVEKFESLNFLGRIEKLRYHEVGIVNEKVQTLLQHTFE